MTHAHDRGPQRRMGQRMQGLAAGGRADVADVAERVTAVLPGEQAVEEDDERSGDQRRPLQLTPLPALARSRVGPGAGHPEADEGPGGNWSIAIERANSGHLVTCFRLPRKTGGPGKAHRQ